jgi:hypothetical protein
MLCSIDGRLYVASMMSLWMLSTSIKLGVSSYTRGRPGYLGAEDDGRWDGFKQ